MMRVPRHPKIIDYEGDDRLAYQRSVFTMVVPDPLFSVSKFQDEVTRVNKAEFLPADESIYEKTQRS